MYRSPSYLAAVNYAAIALVLLILWLVSFARDYLLPLAVVSLVASILFALVSVIWPHDPLNTALKNTHPHAPTLRETPASITEKRGGEFSQLR